MKGSDSKKTDTHYSFVIGGYELSVTDGGEQENRRRLEIRAQLPSAHCKDDIARTLKLVHDVMAKCFDMAVFGTGISTIDQPMADDHGGHDVVYGHLGFAITRKCKDISVILNENLRPVLLELAQTKKITLVEFIRIGENQLKIGFVPELVDFSIGLGEEVQDSALLEIVGQKLSKLLLAGQRVAVGFDDKKCANRLSVLRDGSDPHKDPKLIEKVLRAMESARKEIESGKMVKAEPADCVAGHDVSVGVVSNRQPGGGRGAGGSE